MKAKIKETTPGTKCSVYKEGLISHIDVFTPEMSGLVGKEIEIIQGIISPFCNTMKELPVDGYVVTIDQHWFSGVEEGSKFNFHESWLELPGPNRYQILKNNIKEARYECCI